MKARSLANKFKFFSSQRMVSQKARTSGSNRCEKCGNIMIQKVIYINNSNLKKFQKISQCIVCRHWVEI